MNEGQALGATMVGHAFATEPVSILRHNFGKAILVMSGRRRMMYQNLQPKTGGNNLF